MAKKKVRRKLNVVRTLIFILVVYIIVCGAMYIYKQPVKHYEITGNEYVSDAEILRVSSLDEYPAYVSLLNKKYKARLEKLDLIKSVKIKLRWNFKVIIEIEENTPMLINKTNNEIILKDTKEINDDNYVGLPILLNMPPKEILTKFLNNLALVKEGTRFMINEIEYAPSYNDEGASIDENRFLLSMNDKNLVYITTKRLTRLNNYIDIISTNKIKTNGTLYLDGDEERYPFKYQTTTKATKTKTTKKGETTTTTTEVKKNEN